ncbi:MAG: carbohydrate ABC transporter substrate-binding protein, partial [Oliverpabstia sp.]
MRNVKRWLALSLAGVMTVGMFAGCGSKSETKSDSTAKEDTAKGDAAGESKGGESASGGKVYYLNFKPEADQAWQSLAAT